MAKFFNSVFVVILLSALKCADISACINESPCLCELDDYRKIDLTQVSQKLAEKEFLEDFDSRGNSFFFHGCTDGTFNATEHKIKVVPDVVKASLVWVNTTVTPNITFHNITASKSSEIKFAPIEGEKDSYQIVFKHGENVTARIRLLCDPYVTFIKIFSTDGTNPSLSLTSPHACIIANHPGLSTGSVLLIIFFISFGIYFVGGCLVLYCMRGARGLEMIPNIDFWRSLPGLVKDGIIFLFSGCNTGSITTPETYDRI